MMKCLDSTRVSSQSRKFSSNNVHNNLHSKVFWLNGMVAGNVVVVGSIMFEQCW